ncbi:phenylalanine--tRNA ligase subunit beta [Flaviflexus huanghaiensis]|uniref:phenylalanine--tRNA ligase subunit beta n=1 Tax=Flaviflexus huanghaiensis TaxID=1111473 RepID=UPI0015FAAFD2|nr:phenylalanine--tRNA ligase subunit beta [Flaviflexus huanghaiensis]
MPLIPIDWLSDHVDTPEGLTADELAADLVKVGLEEEEIHRGDITGPIVVGRVLSISKEEQKNGKTINYCRVDVGDLNDEPGEGKEPSDVPSRGIICGAHNFDEGDYVVVSLPGALLPGGFAISARKTYGHISDGMICSMAELGLGTDHDGIIVLARSGDEAAIAALPAVGEDVMHHLGLGRETLEINVTPDRGYCFSMRGVAREYSHSTGARFTDPGLPENLESAIPEPSDEPNVVLLDEAPINAAAGCDRFVTRVVRGIDPSAQSPAWMRDRLTEAGMRPISLAVDVTNYVMLDLGQPLHAYDFDALELPIVVRRARAGERLTTLDDVERTLHPEDLLITDTGAERILGLAGVMGGASTEISESTVNVLIEAAHFDSTSIARTARRHRLPSEASKRFERGVDTQIAPVAAQRVVDLLVEYGGGAASDAVTDVDHTAPLPTIAFDPAEVTRLTGLTPSREETAGILRQIGCRVSDSFDVAPPSWRPDLVGPAHLVEEIARLIGYDEIATLLPASPAGRGLTDVQRRRRDIMRTLAEMGWTEALSYPFVSASVHDDQGIPDDDERRAALRLRNPLQDDVPLMRTSILDSLLRTAALNVARQNAGTAVVEAGLVTHPAGITPIAAPPGGVKPSDEVIAALHAAIPNQPHHVAGVAVPRTLGARAGFEPVVWDWRDAIEAVRSICRIIGLSVTVHADSRAPFHPGRCARIEAAGTIIGYAGELAPAVCTAVEIPARSIAFEVDTDAMSAVRGVEPISVKPVRTHPAAKEDIALVVADSVTAAEVEAIIRSAAGELLEDTWLFDVYAGEQLPDGTKSLAFALQFRADHTLTAEETAAVRARIVKRARKVVGASLRE